MRSILVFLALVALIIAIPTASAYPEDLYEAIEEDLERCTESAPFECVPITTAVCLLRLCVADGMGICYSTNPVEVDPFCET